jgi:hypothetical protein
MRKNLSGEPMEAGTSSEMRLVLRRVRRYCDRRGALLTRFRQVYGYETKLGPEWHAGVRHWGDAAVLVHLCMCSERDKAVAVEHAHLSGQDGWGNAYVVNFVGPSDFVRSMLRSVKGQRPTFRADVLER